MGLDIREDPAGDIGGTDGLQEAADRLARIGGTGGKPEDVPKKPGPVKLGAGLAAVPAAVAGRIRREEYVDFTELPPAQPDGSAVGSQSGEQLLIVQAADYRRTRRRIPDVATWSRCFILYVGTAVQKDSAKLMDLLGYMDAIVRAAQKFTWPACEEYDRRFHQMVAGDEHRQWATLDAGLYTECFTAQALPAATARAPLKGGQTAHDGSRKRPRDAGGAELEQERAEAGTPVCGKYNRYRGDCKFGARCRYLHVCSRCRGSHPVSQCEAGQKL